MITWWLFCLVTCFPVRYDESAKLNCKRTRLDALPSTTSSYDLVIIGAGAAGLFASGAAQLLGQRTALIERGPRTGGDCSNSACVPSKALRSAAASSNHGVSLSEARQYVADTVHLVRQREDPDAIQERNKNLDVLMVDSCRFISSSLLQVRLRNATSNETLLVEGKKFILATGASPVVPKDLQQAADQAGIPVLTYKSFLTPEGDPRIWNLDQTAANNDNNAGITQQKRIVVVGGGATACEIGQSLARLCRNSTQVVLVAPEILPTEDVRLRDAALRLLENCGIRYRRSRLHDIRQDRSLVLDDNDTIPDVDAILLCIGRSPTYNLEKLDLSRAGIAWTSKGVSVFPGSLRSTTNPRVYAVGDCSDAVPARFRTSTLAAWTAFHAVRNAILPRMLWFGSRSVHPCVPRVVYTDPELACVGLTLGECTKKYGAKGFHSLCVPEIGSDRADMERSNRDTSVTFVELRAEPITSRILGASACGPAAAEIANTIGMAIINHLTVGSMARSLYSYPSYGYLMHRVALSMYLSDACGLLEVCGPLPGLLSGVVRNLLSFTMTLRRTISRIFRGILSRRKRSWETQGVCKSLCIPASVDTPNRIVSYADLKDNYTLLEAVSYYPPVGFEDFIEWAGKQG